MTGLGIDLGSRQAKFAALEGGEVLWLRDFETIPFYKRFASMREGVLNLDFAAMDLFDGPPPAALSIVVTGYGRNTLGLEGARVVPEIQAHVQGVRFQTGLTTFTMLDLGGQDSKVARVENGILMDFVMNDKCAASSGRYLENMAKVLDLSLEELSRHHRDPVPLDATCGIFGESELIGKIIEGHSLERLCAGVNNTLIKRVAPMLHRFPQDTIVLTGGVAKSAAFRELLRESTGAGIVVPEHPQHNGALGCAVLAGK
ncbi:MAG: 2-hydroxyglutaryl-CoA dehydratase [Desulfuromonas sp.]|uniref:acyl-CoA dehydratase activase n=1 Tax=Desulfuromonas sp. TaxID=892 RepID=UPI000CB95BDC|nr:acyl-CoA dehydratase activase [Desulfuromonas sp.]PLX82364.1 MAG: 2-hydroxyglutaryl-CoA dehydratase [Desulfuromonas sp.]